MRIGRLPREAAYTGENQYFITVNVRDRQPRFTDAQLVETCRDQIAAACEANGFRVVAECYMPDHLHLLLEGLTGGADLRRCMKDIKQRTSYQAIRLGIGPLWQPGYYDRILRQDEHLAGYVEYILQNPVRAGLVKRAEDYPYARTLISLPLDPVAPDPVAPDPDHSARRAIIGSARAARRAGM